MNIAIDSNFPGGAVEKARFENPNTIYFRAPKNGSPQSLWYNFRIDGGKGKVLRLVQQQLEDVLGLLESRTYAFTVPVVKHGDEASWQRIEESAVSFKKNPLEYEFTFLKETDTTYVAFSYPYTFDNLNAFLEKHRSNEYLNLEHIGTTAEGRPYPCLMVGAPENDLTQIVIITARHHAGEVSGSYVLEGIIESFLEQLRSSRLETAAIALLVFPLVDLDSVETGRYGKGRPPVDFNRDWTACPLHEEIRLIQSRIEKAAASSPLLLYMDLHAPQPGGTTYIVPARASSYETSLYEQIWELYGQVEKSIEGFSTCRIKDLDPFALNWGQEAYQHTSVQYQARRYQIPALTLETSYHYDSSKQLLDPVKWQGIGKKLWETVIGSFCKGARFGDMTFSPIPSGEIGWRYWEMVSLPDNCTLEENTSVMTIHSSAGGKAFVTFRTYIPTTEKASVIIQYSSGDKNLSLEVTTYYYKDRIVYDRYDTQYLSFIPGEHTFYPMRNGALEDWNSYRIAVKVDGLVGSLSVQIQVTSGS